MRKVIIQFIVLFFICSSPSLFSQYFQEQNSGVNVNLTSVSMNHSSMYGNLWVCGYSGTVIKTINGGSTWLNVSGNGLPANVNLVNIWGIDTNVALTAGNIGTITYLYRTSNKGANWSTVFTQANGNINTIWFKTSASGIICGNPVGGRWSLWLTTNGGLNWDSTGMFLAQSGNETGWNNSLCIVNNRIWFGTNNSRIYTSIIKGNWQILPTPETNSYSVSFYYGDSTYGYFGGVNSYKTTNKGLNWTLLTCAGNRNFSAFTFGNMEGMQGVDFAFRNDSCIYRNSSQWGSNWMWNYSAPAGVYRHAAYSFNYMNGYSWAVRSNGGITKFEIAFGEVKKISSEIPKRFSLSQNYPNPFNPKSKIQYQIKKTDFVQLKLYDILGHEVTSLVSERETPGTYEVEFNASNFPSGVYFYKLITTDFTDVKKLVLVK